MKNYNYKIQWLFNVTSNFVTPKEKLIKDLYSLIKILGAKSFDKILFRDKDLKIIETYSSMNQYSYEQASTEAIAHIKKQLKTNDKIYLVELLKN
jgi:hypothetical protein